MMAVALSVKKSAQSSVAHYNCRITLHSIVIMISGSCAEVSDLWIFLRPRGFPLIRAASCMQLYSRSAAKLVLAVEVIQIV